MLCCFVLYCPIVLLWCRGNDESTENAYLKCFNSLLHTAATVICNFCTVLQLCITTEDWLCLCLDELLIFVLTLTLAVSFYGSQHSIVLLTPHLWIFGSVWVCCRYKLCSQAKHSSLSSPCFTDPIILLILLFIIPQQKWKQGEKCCYLSTLARKQTSICVCVWMLTSDTDYDKGYQ